MAMRILFITATRIGDAVMSTALLGYLGERYPDARLTIACGAPAAPLFAAVSRLERLIVLRTRRFKGHWLTLWGACIGRRWDLIVDLRGSGLAWTLLARERRVKLVRNAELHRIEELAGVFGLDPPPAPVIQVSAAAEAEATALMPAGRPVLCLGPTANWHAKEWPIERFLALATALTAPDGMLADAHISVLGAPEERARAAPLIDALSPNRRIDLFGRSLPVAYACIRRATLFVGNDSGLMHLAAASGTPTLGLFGPSPEWNYAPWGPNAAFVRTRESYDALVGRPGFDFRTAGCLMEGLSIEAALQAVDALWSRCGETNLRGPDELPRYESGPL